MPNDIRTPRQGKSDTSRRIAQAVDNVEWQEFRLSLKGLPTVEKLDRLHTYWADVYDHGSSSLFFDIDLHVGGWGNCDGCIRVDNYIKALCRGGQLYPGESLLTCIEQSWNIRIKR